MGVCQIAQRFEFEDHGIETNEVGFVGTSHLDAFIEHWKRDLSDMRDSTIRHFSRERFLINRFEKSTS